jgi:hypothetical protein
MVLAVSCNTPRPDFNDETGSLTPNQDAGATLGDGSVSSGSSGTNSGSGTNSAQPTSTAQISVQGSSTTTGTSETDDASLNTDTADTDTADTATPDADDDTNPDTVTPDADDDTNPDTVTPDADDDTTTDTTAPDADDDTTTDTTTPDADDDTDPDTTDDGTDSSTADTTETSVDSSTTDEPPACEEDEHRCDEDYEVCENGQWVVEEACGDGICSTQLGGCVASIGQACEENADCGEGTCQESAGGGNICCSANCGECKQCAESGESCTDLVETRPGCSCDADDISNCVDGISCTDDVCVEGACENPVSTGFCLIDEECVAHNTRETGNPCRYCDSVSLSTGWSNSPETQTCDDGLYCTGEDSCDGSGSCAHEFATNNRCAGVTGECALSVCNEQRDSCVEPSGTDCDSDVEPEESCEEECGGDVLIETLVAECNGQSASCLTESTGWDVKEACSQDEKCDEASFTCKPSLECGDTWCDPDTNLCWMRSLAQATMTWTEANEYCAELELKGATWRLPHANELAAVSRGCNGQAGTAQNASYKSTCRMSESTWNYIECTACPVDEGPTDECYWVTEFGDCPSGEDAYVWSSTEADTFPGSYFYFKFRDGNMNIQWADGPTYSVRCVTDVAN